MNGFCQCDDLVLCSRVFGHCLVYVFQVEELALNSMIRKSNSDTRLQPDKKCQSSAKSHARRKETEVSIITSTFLTGLLSSE